ncbi:ATP synthase small subunit 6, mitochondrial-like [Populus alba]|uniref:ATP synthase small subunit 6, mitochondrial-like n=1 Tax=Populus alba TaxID=43335 RepID=UPI0015883241|nr:uncharacterized protein LOC118059771 [Populus alba]
MAGRLLEEITGVPRGKCERFWSLVSGNEGILWRFRDEKRESKNTRKFDPWPVFFRREWNRNWPFLVGFAITGTLITKFSLSLTEEDAKNSPFVQRHKR